MRRSVTAALEAIGHRPELGPPARDASQPQHRVAARHAELLLTLNVKNKYFEVKHPKWKGQTLYQLYEKAYTPWSWFRKLKKGADDSGLIFLSTAFDRTAVDFLENLGVSIHKIASFELVDLPLIEYMAKTKKPVILKRGLSATLEEWLASAEYILVNGNPNVVLCERGIRTFETAIRNTADLAIIPLVRKLSHLPVIFDPSHATGKRDLWHASAVSLMQALPG